jgi:C4-dicarboxylate-specific signal transduction histidine kinase
MASVNTARSAFTHSLPWVIAPLIVIIFVADTLTNLEIAVAALYVVVVLLSFFRFEEPGIVTVSSICAGLIVVSYLITPRGDRDAGLVNNAIGLLTIAATTYLALAIKRAQREATAARAQLARASRMTVLGELTASIAHEINQPLAAVAANGGAGTRWLAMQPPNLDEARNALARITRDANRASAIIARVRTLAAAGGSVEEWLGVNEAIREIMALLEAELLANRTLALFDLGEDVPAVLADRIQLQQVLVNLVMNAIEAMHDSPGRRELVVSSRHEPRVGVVISIRDFGRGLEPGIAERMFDPFYTTKAEGMGMGLAISRTIVETHGGRITAMPAAPRGTIVRVTLPVARTGPVATPVAAEHKQ